MGYRSDIGMAGGEELKFVVESVASFESELKEFVDYGENVSGCEESFRHTWESVKYYDGYPDVDALNGIMDFFDHINHDEYYGFIRIGEETEDIEQRGCPYEFDMYINRSIEI